MALNGIQEKMNQTQIGNLSNVLNVEVLIGIRQEQENHLKTKMIKRNEDFNDACKEFVSQLLQFAGM